MANEGKLNRERQRNGEIERERESVKGKQAMAGEGGEVERATEIKVKTFRQQKWNEQRHSGKEVKETSFLHCTRCSTFRIADGNDNDDVAVVVVVGIGVVSCFAIQPTSIIQSGIMVSQATL